MESFFQEIKARIIPLHDEAERDGPLHAIVSHTITTDDYRFVLQRVYGFVAPAETAIARLAAATAIGIDYTRRTRQPHLEKDLAFLRVRGYDIERLPACENARVMSSVPEALGMLYLFEGSRLGGQVLAKALREHLGLTDLQGYAYFASNGANVGTLWQSFRSAVGSYVASHGHEEEIIYSAQRSFAMLNEWLRSPRHE